MQKLYSNGTAQVNKDKRARRKVFFNFTHRTTTKITNTIFSRHVLHKLHVLHNRIAHIATNPRRQYCSCFHFYCNCPYIVIYNKHIRFCARTLYVEAISQRMFNCKQTTEGSVRERGVQIRLSVSGYGPRCL